MVNISERLINLMKGLLYTYGLGTYDDDELIKDILLLDEIQLDARRDKLTEKDWTTFKNISAKYKCDEIDIDNKDWEKINRIDIKYFHNGYLSELCLLNQKRKKDGLYIEWYENGQKKCGGTFKNGKENGLWTKWDNDEDGRKKEEGTYKNGEKDGVWTFFYPYDGMNKKEEGTYKDGEKDGVFTWWRRGGKKEKQETYKNGKKDGVWIQWNKYERKWKEENYKDDKLDGLYTEYGRNGKRKVERTYKDGKLDGLWTYFHRSYLDRYWGSGIKSKQRSFKDGREDGLYTEWYYNGQKKIEGTFKNNNKKGEWVYYKQNGIIKKIKTFD